MTYSNNIINLKDYTKDELVTLMGEIGEAKFRAKQIFKWLYRGISSIDEMTDLSKSLRDKLKERFYVSSLTVHKKWVSKIDGTMKYLLKLGDGNMIESVLMQYHHGNTICISSQVGCAMGCRFCASTIGGLVRSLTAGEIIDQVMTVGRDSGLKISNIVMMGIGEPLANFDNVIKFLKNVNDPDGLNIGYRHISLSTCGLADKIYELSEYNFPITLSISLHASENEVRSAIMPVNNKFNIETLLDACRAYTDKTGRRISFEYAMIKGVTDTPELAEKLAMRIKGMLCHVNLIPVNNVEERDYEKPTKESMKQFIDILEKHHIAVTVRRELGSDISASCGQLRRNEEVNAGK